MAKSPTIIPVSDLKQEAARVLDGLKKTDAAIITQRGRATAVLMSVDAYDRAESERELLLLLARGEKEIASGLTSTIRHTCCRRCAIVCPPG